ncbi:hypothetical protein J2741_001720 [Methanolinea mesophila]|uniref:hypothetical protein n=1 Tax=Methanolinea mesophila TaxID=547055 RepID=UPI001AE9788B|nr:hypothetical protein [Methanolinea mesophila]MBP1929173.1 hypothetical protein [Methanolinea mesophila]
MSDDPADPDASYSLQFTWNGYVPENLPPEYIVVEVYDVMDGERLGSFSVPRENPACEPEHPCTYGSTVDMGILPSGEFMLVGYDPLSGATARQQISVSPHGDGNEEFLDRVEPEPAFFFVSGILMILLVIILAILVGRKK